MRYLCICLLIFLFFNAHLLKSQEKKTDLISGNFTTSTLEQFARQVESQVNCHFYIDPALSDSFKITLNLQEQPLSRVLALAFKDSEIQYAIDPDGHVFLTKDRRVETLLPFDFFEKDTTNEISENAITISDYLAFKKPDALLSSLENQVIEIGAKSNPTHNGKGTISGNVRDSKTGEPLAGVLVYTKEPIVGVYTNPFGFYSISLPLGNHVLYVKYVGMKDTKRPVALYSDGQLNIELHEIVITLKDIVVISEKINNVRTVQMGVAKLSVQTIKQIPTLFGEKDILKVALSLPGVKSVGEASAGFNVRGGASDQNLILFNNATIYNPSHLFGFFSAINSDVVKDVELYKSCIPPKYGGRLSSLLEITNRDGNEKKITGTAGIGILTSHFSIEGPILKDKISFILGARTTYSDWLLKILPENSGYSNSSASFYDMNLNIKYQFNPQNNFYFTGYLSKDRFNLSLDTSFNYENKNFSIKWRHLYNSKFNAVFITGYDYYNYGASLNSIPVNSYKYYFNIEQVYLKADFNVSFSSKNILNFGFNTQFEQIHPGNYKPNELQSLVNLSIIQTERALESALYVNDEFDITDQLTLNTGIRYSIFNFLGPSKVNRYQNNMPKSQDNILDTVIYKRGEIAKTYHGPEFRISARYSIDSDLSIKAGYNTLRQYIHMLSNSTAISPADIWKLSDPNIKPQFGDQYSLGVYKNFKNNSIETSMEIYYKHIKNYLDYKSGAMLMMNHHIETEVFTTKGKAYGIEFMLKKTSGKLNGWFTYTYSRTFLKMDDSNAGESINNGAYYPANYDKPHDLSFIGNYKFSHRYSISLNITYSTGRPITMLINKYYYNGAFRAFYSNRNAYRIPDYFRSDLSVNIEGNHKVKQLIHSSWTFGLYNLTGRKNPYSIYFTTNSKGQIQGYKLSIMGTVIPFITCNLRF